MKHSKVTYLSPSRSSPVRKPIRFTDDNKKSNKVGRRCCRMPGWCSKCLPILILSLLGCGAAVGIFLGLWLSPVLNRKATTSSSTDQTNLSTTAGNTMTTVSSNVTSLSSTSSTNSTLITSPPSTVAVTSMSSTTSTSTETSTSSTTSTTTMATFCINWTWNATGITIAGNSSSGSALNQLNSPWNIHLDRKTNILYIADSQNHRIIKWLPNASSGTIIAGTGIPGAQANQLNTPKDVFIDSLDNIYVADTNNQRVQLFPNGNTTGSTVSTTWGVGALYGVFVYNQSIYACDYTNGAVWNNGTTAAGNQGLGGNSNQLNQPQGFTVDTLTNQSTMYIANSKQHTIVQWFPGASTGNIVAGTNGVANTSNNTFNFPLAVKLDPFSNLFVVDNNNHRIQLYCRHPSISSSGRTIAGVTGTPGISPMHLDYPAGLALDSSLNLYVSDTTNHRIQKFMRIS